MIMPSHGCCVCLQEMCTFNLVQSELSNVLLEKYPPSNMDMGIVS